VTSEWNFKRKDGAIHLGEAVVRQLPDGRLQAIMRNIADRKKAEEALRIQTEELRSLSVRLQKTREEERTLVARDLHDEIGQVLTGLKLDMSWIARRLPEDSQELREKIESTLTLANTGMGWVRKICTQLRPGILDDLGLAAAIEWQAKEFEGRTAIHCNVSLPAGNVDLDQERSTAVFRIFQEALTNVSRHSKATQVEVSLREENEAILLAIRDNGIGMQTSPGQPGRSFGLLGMRERALVFGGKVEFSGAGGGTTVTVSIPHPRLASVSSKNKGEDANSDRR
jgi:signal transduction histidine kinase